MLLYAELLVSLAHPGGVSGACVKAADAAAFTQQLEQHCIRSVCCCRGDPSATAAEPAATQEPESSRNSAIIRDTGSSSNDAPVASPSCRSQSSNNSNSRCLHFESLRFFGEALLRAGFKERLLQQLLQAFRSWTLEDPQLLLLAVTAHVGMIFSSSGSICCCWWCCCCSSHIISTGVYWLVAVDPAVTGIVAARCGEQRGFDGEPHTY